MSNSTLSIPKPKQQCIHCNKLFINLKQHITKSHNKILIEIRPNGFLDGDKHYRTIKIENDTREEGEFGASGSDEKGWFADFQWYKDDETINLRVYQDDTWKLERYSDKLERFGDGEYSVPMYTHNIQVVYKNS